MSDTLRPIELIAHPGQPVQGRGTIERLVGNSLAYVRLNSGLSFAFGAQDIKGYDGRSFASMGLRKGVVIDVAFRSVLDRKTIVISRVDDR
jgi:hypothetical protein